MRQSQAVRENLRNSRQGQSMVEFALTFLLFISMVLGFGQIALTLWIKTTLHHAVREGARYAITGATKSGLGHDASIRQRVMVASGSLIDSAQAASMITIEYFDQNGAPSADNTGGNTIVLSVSNYPIPWLVAAPISPLGNGLTVSVSAVDRLENFRTPPPR
jgi:Flp pilus assembly protein TadG